MFEKIDTPIQYLKGVGPKKAKALSGLGITTIEDLLYYFPRRYEDRTKFVPISKLEKGQTQTIKATVLACKQRQAWKKKRFHILEVAVGDKSGKIFCVWFNQSYLKNYFTVGQSLVLYGKVHEYSGRLQMTAPEFELAEQNEDIDSLDIGRIVPVYSLPDGLTQRQFRKMIKKCLDNNISEIKEFLTYEIRAKYTLLNLAKSLINIHFPESLELKKEAFRRLSFEEFFLFQLPIVIKKIKKKEVRGLVHSVSGEMVNKFISNLPFKLTASQEQVILEIKQDMESPHEMQRLLQGDVGSGKTVVATVASVMAIQGGYQVAFMVPTEILARQHFDKVVSQFSCLNIRQDRIIVELLTSSSGKKNKEKIHQGLKDGRINMVIGTHALIEEAVRFKNLGLVVIDEQHKFGVSQRSLLPHKGTNPDILIMTATPIPRTLAITLYGDLDISVINELPPGRKPVETMLFSENQRKTIYRIIEENIIQGRQAYIVYPIIEESFELDLQAAVQMYEKLKHETFNKFRVGLVHGRLNNKEQQKTMSEFLKGKIDILVATTVLEVGVDVPNASIMVIEHAQRFGLSQLHQLRGRIGRGPYSSHCILVAQVKTEEARLRIKAIIENNNGFRIAEEDLKIRGPGEFFGRRQHGLCELRIADPLTQLQLLKDARDEAIRIVNLDPFLTLRQNVAIRQALIKRFPGYKNYMGSFSQ